jgi:uncharacterized membrane protein
MRILLKANMRPNAINEMTPSGGLCYAFGILFPLLYLTFGGRNQNNFLRFHSFQCLILFSIWIPTFFIHAAWSKGFIALVWSSCFAAWIVSWVMAARRRRFHLPVIGALAEWLTGSSL